MDHKRRHSRGSGFRDEASIENIGVIEMLEHDSRPTFIVDLNRAWEPPFYFNPSLRKISAVDDILQGHAFQDTDGSFSDFGKWIWGQNQSDEEVMDSRLTSYGGMLWAVFTLRQRYRVVSGRPGTNSHMSRSGQEELLLGTDTATVGTHRYQEDDGVSFLSTSSADRHAYGCTDLSIPARRFSRHVQFFREIDWTSTPLDHIDEWPLQLHQMCNFLMSDETPAFVLWGPELVVIYNEAAIEVLLDRHPHVMGLPLHDVYPEVWDQILVLIRKVQTTGKAVRLEEKPMYLNRRGRLEEVYFTFQYQPITDEKGAVLGLYETFMDVTKQKHAARRLSTLLAISTCSFAKDIKTFWRHLLGALDTNTDLPFAILYSVERAWSDRASVSTDNEPNQVGCILEGQLGVPEGHVAAPERLRLYRDSQGYALAFQRAMESGNALYLGTDDGSLPQAYVSGLKYREIKEPSDTVVVFPIRPTVGVSNSTVVGFLVIGISPHLILDDNLRQFIDILNRQIATSVAAVLLLDEEIRQRQEVAQQLDVRTQELMNSEDKFQRLADTSPVGIVAADPQGNIAYANQAFYDITGHSGNDRGRESWLTLFQEDAQPTLMAEWIQLHQTRKPITIEVPLKKAWRRNLGNGESEQAPAWILLSAFVEELNDGSISGSRATVTDISQQKWAESIQTRRMEEAMELKRQQEAFIDMTSHEIRNPLSAIIQSADSISLSLAACRIGTPATSHTMPVSKEVIDDSIDAAETIALCAQHQKRVIDDVLTLSKLDADLLLITAVEVEPLRIIQHVLRIFDTESRKHNIAVGLLVDESFHRFHAAQVRLDPSRLTQVLVNILGNAIKFTQLADERRITVKVAASLENPSETVQEMEYIPPQRVMNGVLPTNGTSGQDYLYLKVAVQDTGPGLNPAEKQMLFKRFGQASPRTHVQYGGSGLGLFISKKLSELQGGAIGFSSEPGQGSIFAFYVLAWRSLVSPRHAPDLSLGRIALPDHRSAEMLSNPRASPPALAEAKVGSLDTAPQSMSILVVEDNLVNQRVLCKQLRNLGHVVYAANHGGEAITFLQKTQYWKGMEKNSLLLNIILLDTEMPVMDGLTCAKKIRELQRSGDIRKHIPIISVTANARSEQMDTANAAGMDDAISKPFRVVDLTPKMEALVQRYGSG